MDTKERVEKQIETFYERSTISIPEVEKRHYFKDQPNQLNISNKADAKTAKKFELYKGFLASERVKVSTQGRIHQVIPDDSDPRNARFSRARVPIVEQKHYKKHELSADSRPMFLDQASPNFFTNSDVIQSRDPENVRLLSGYQDPNDISYPSIINQSQNPEYDVYYPIIDEEEFVDKETKINVKVDAKVEVKIVENSKTQDEQIQQTNIVVEQVTNMPAPSKDNFVIHEVKHDDTIGKLCIIYNVNKDIIRMANDFMGEEIYMFKSLKIPYTYGPMYKSHNTNKSEEEIKKEFAIDALDKILRETHKGKQADYIKEAKFYLEMNDYNLTDA
jgi:LysM repeat protein